ncbi:MAG TPA: MlaD family protein [Candidatus Binataceae bacterium]|nr:MlaD family protein [Candidatus Binataceae bacterium]
MARTGISAMRVGVTIAAAIVVLCIAIFQIGHGSRIFTRTQRLEAHFHRINGLQSGAPVMLVGLRIGAVDSIEFPTDMKSDYVAVKMWIEQSAAPRVRVDSIAQIDSMGLLGDKYVELSTGSASAAPAASGAVIPVRDPIDYEALLQKPGVTETLDNLMAISGSMRSILDSINKGNGILSQLIHGAPGAAPNEQLNLATIQRTLVQLDALAAQLTAIATQLQKGEGVMGAMFSNKTNGQAFINSIWYAATAAQKAADDADRMMGRFDKAGGIVPQLLEDKKYAADVLDNLRKSSRDLKDILQKINSGKGTAGLMVNDPKLYNQLTGFLDDGGGWGIRLVRGLYNLTHPFASPEPANTPQSVMIAPAEGGSCPANPAAARSVTSAVPATMNYSPVPHERRQ